MHFPWRRKQQPSEEQSSSLPSEQHSFFLGSVSTLGATFVYRRYFRRLRTAEWVTPDVLERRGWVRGVVTSVGDADNFRLYHTPAIGWRWPLKFRRGVQDESSLTESTNPQPYAAESLAWLKNAIEGKTVYCQLVRRDQYSRIVSVVTLPPPFLPGWLTTGRSLALEMLRAGTGLTYEQAGAEYGKYGKDEAARRGMWKHGTAGRNARAGGSDVEAQTQGRTKTETENSKRGGLRGILKRIWT
ncbi:hypothetical protein DFH29DRAFT_986269 [Suillus ampliporus]|nr:hypothetical protein DFH29DRAFT_986269 [Suillus ampliporus]